MLEKFIDNISLKLQIKQLIEENKKLKILLDDSYECNNYLSEKIANLALDMRLLEDVIKETKICKK